MQSIGSKLPSPALHVSGDGNDASEDDPNKHQGRVRSFPHERGIWASYVYIDYDDCDAVDEMANELKTLLEASTGTTLSAVDRRHISLTKTFTLRHHNIAPFVDNLRERLATHRRFRVEFAGLEVYVNEERTRTFVGIRVAEQSYLSLNELVTNLDACMREYRLPEYYADPSYHISILWVLGDHEDTIRSHLPTLTPVFERIYDEEFCDITQTIKMLHFDCGNRSFHFNLV